MPEKSFICLGRTPAAEYACAYLREAGWTVMKSPTAPDTGILLDVPSFGPGRNENTPEFRERLPGTGILYGGNLPEAVMFGRKAVDLLLDERYLAENAAITAHCALGLGQTHTGYIYQDLPVLVLGWGRIGKCLGMLLQSCGARVSVCARKEGDLAMAQSLGFEPIFPSAVAAGLSRFRLIFNTVPATILTGQDMLRCKDCAKIDLASVKVLPGEDVVWARGLPGKYAPKSSGALIARTILRLEKEGF